MDNISDLRKKINQRFADLETRLNTERVVPVKDSRKAAAAKPAETAVTDKIKLPESAIKTAEQVLRERENTKAESEASWQRFARIEENYEREIGRLKKEIADARKREVELTEQINQANVSAQEKAVSEIEDRYKSDIERMNRELDESRLREDKIKEEMLALKNDLEAARDNGKIDELENRLSENVSEVEKLRKLLDQKEEYLKGLMKSTSSFLDSALKQEQERMASLVDKTANVLFEKKEYELQLKELKDQYSSIKDELGKKDKIIDGIMKKNSEFMELFNSQGSNELKMAEFEKKNLELNKKISELENILKENKKNPEPPAAPAPPAPAKEQKMENAAGKDNLVAQESLNVINKFIGWLGKPAVDMEAAVPAEPRSAEVKPEEAETKAAESEAVSPGTDKPPEPPEAAPGNEGEEK